ncbi:putative oxidoreductase [Jatrophihabitans sp. GAS493]|uniref:DoxX family protein n=1 Tax=Jatrophihabitans sp. GAS493 TaxID=1907575 RepID=UPI000BB7F860|nr:DoxX family protein [Jatrophihabitans sp. GAS493]SOD71801.1 putative oxidoreductase [Jatrophihabitans sp. GAS493]
MKPKTTHHASVEISRGLLRLALGGTMIAHGVRHARSLEGTAGWFGSIGFREPRLQAQLSSVVEVGAGTALICGAATPLAASAVVGTMAVAAETVHRPNGYFITSEGWEYVGFISAAAVALAAMGSGRYSLDRLLGVENRGSGLSRGLLAAGLGLGGAAIQLKTFWTRPVADASS